MQVEDSQMPLEVRNDLRNRSFTPEIYHWFSLTYGKRIQARISPTLRSEFSSDDILQEAAQKFSRQLVDGSLEISCLDSLSAYFWRVCIGTLYDKCRKRKAVKRGGKSKRLTLDDVSMHPFGDGQVPIDSRRLDSDESCIRLYREFYKRGRETLALLDRIRLRHEAKTQSQSGDWER